MYRDKDKVTDVISFALEEDEPEIDMNELDTSSFRRYYYMYRCST